MTSKTKADQFSGGTRDRLKSAEGICSNGMWDHYHHNHEV